MNDLTKGSPFKVIIKFALPIYVGQLFFLMYGIIDTRIVGSFLGSDALAAVGSVSTLIDFSHILLNGFVNGFGIIVATFFGAKNIKGMKNAISWMGILGLAVTIVIVGIQLLFLDPILKFLNVSTELADFAGIYVYIVLSGLIAGTFYNVCVVVLRSVGDSVTPLIFLILSNVLNGVLDYILVSKTTLGITGAALATVFSQVVSAVACFIYMCKKHPSVVVHKEDLYFDCHTIRELLASGISMCIMNSFVHMGTLALQTAINTFGANIIVAHVAARKIGSICMTPFSCFGMALATYCGQNLGAGLLDRIKSGIKAAYFSSICWLAFAYVMIRLFAPRLISLLTASDNPEVIKNGTLYLYVNGAMYWVTAGISILRNSMQGFGDRKTPLVSSFIELVGKIVVVSVFTSRFGYWAIILSEPTIWVVMIIPLLIGTYKKLHVKTAVEATV